MLSNNQTYRLTSSVTATDGTEFPAGSIITITKIGKTGNVRFTSNHQSRRYQASKIEVALNAEPY